MHAGAAAGPAERWVRIPLDEAQIRLLMERLSLQGAAAPESLAGRTLRDLGVGLEVLLLNRGRRGLRAGVGE